MTKETVSDWKKCEQKKKKEKTPQCICLTKKKRKKIQFYNCNACKTIHRVCILYIYGDTQWILHTRHKSSPTNLLISFSVSFVSLFVRLVLLCVFPLPLSCRPCTRWLAFHTAACFVCVTVSCNIIRLNILTLEIIVCRAKQDQIFFIGIESIFRS